MKMLRRGRKGGVVIETILILAGLGLITKAFLIGTTTYKFTHIAQPAEGVITSINNHGFSANIQIMPGSTQSIVFVQRGFFQRSAANERVETLYNPANPREAHMQKFFALWSDTIMFGLPGLICLILGFRLRTTRNI